MSLQWRWDSIAPSIGVVSASLLLLAGCGESGGSGSSSMEPDAEAGDVGVDERDAADTDPRDVRSVRDVDDTSDPDTDPRADADGDAGRHDGGYDPVFETRKNYALENFRRVDDDYAVTHGGLSEGSRGDHPAYSWVKLLDISDPMAVEVADVRVFERQSAVPVPYRGGILLAAQDLVLDDDTNSRLLHFAIRDGKLREVARFSDPLNAEDPYDGTPANFISNDERAVLTTGQELVSVSLGTSQVGGDEQTPVVDDRIERTGEGSSRGHYSTLLGEGRVVELHEGATVWSFDVSDDASNPVGDVTVEDATSRWWDYAPDVGHVYLAGWNPDSTTHVLDVTDPEQPSLAATLDNSNYFDEEFEQTTGLEVADERLYWARARGAHALHIYDISQPDDPQQVASLDVSDIPRPEGESLGSLYTLAADGETLYIGYDDVDGPDLPDQSIIGVDQTTLDEQ